jgi:HD superfamily phosphohydrolase
MKKINTWYGDVEIPKVVEDILEAKEMVRLGKINQYGAIYQLYHEFRTTRLEHSIGVYALLNKLGASLEEQIAGLLHDISHTAFSHVVDFALADMKNDESYHEIIAEKYLEDSDIAVYLANHGFQTADIMRFEHGPGLLERNYPDLCADRFDYILRDLHVFELLSEVEIQSVIDCTGIWQNTIILEDPKVALMLCMRMIEGNYKIWNNPYQIYLAHILSSSLNIALEKKYLCLRDLLGTDNKMFRTLQSLEDMDIQSLLQKFSRDVVVTNDPKNYELHMHTKARLIDPLVRSNNGSCVRLTSLFPEYAAQKQDFLNYHDKGYFLHVRDRLPGEEIVS